MFWPKPTGSPAWGPTRPARWPRTTTGGSVSWTPKATSSTSSQAGDLQPTCSDQQIHRPVPPIVEGRAMTETEQRNTALVLKAFETLFNKRDYAAAQHFWSPDYIQHSAHIPPGREGLFELVKASSPDMHYENALITANGDYVILHGRFRNVGQPADWIVADIVRIEDGVLAEHWDVIQDEATAGESQSGLPMFGNTFPTRT